jgi:hypothetical protein
MSHMKQQAYDDIINLKYSGDKHNFNFETYCNKHSRAHKTLVEYNEPVS